MKTIWLSVINIFFVSFLFGQEEILNQAASPINLLEVKQKISYPKEAKDKGISGKVIVEVSVNEAGELIEYEVVASPDTILTLAVVKNIQSLKFTPCIENGVKVKSSFFIPFAFNLYNDSKKKN